MKYGNEKVITNEFKFDSKGEAILYSELKLRQLGKEIIIKELQPKVYLTKAKILYKPDFKVFDLKTKVNIWIEFKGAETVTWRLKRRLWEYYGAGKLEVYKINKRGIYLHESINTN